MKNGILLFISGFVLTGIGVGLWVYGQTQIEHVFGGIHHAGADEAVGIGIGIFGIGVIIVGIILMLMNRRER